MPVENFNSSIKEVELFFYFPIDRKRPPSQKKGGLEDGYLVNTRYREVKRTEIFFDVEHSKERIEA